MQKNVCPLLAEPDNHGMAGCEQGRHQLEHGDANQSRSRSLNGMLQSQINSASVLVVGDAMLDRYWFGDVQRISPEAPVPIVHVTSEEYRLGGAANVALNVASLGAHAMLMSIVGADEASKQLKALLDHHGVESILKSDAQIDTTVKLRVSGRAQQLLRIDFEKRPREAALSSLMTDFRKLLPRFGAVVFSDYGKGALAQIAAMIRIGLDAGLPVLVDPKGADFSPYAGATILTPNRTELARVVGEWRDNEDMAARAQSLRAELGLCALLVTRSEEGMSLFDDEGHLRIPTQAREVFDVTGAGDTVIGTLGALVATGMPLREAVPIANTAAGIVVGKFGTATASPGEVFA
jgi:D-glycero-beta-D-manno-heptose-7-phosphate kinase